MTTHATKQGPTDVTAVDDESLRAGASSVRAGEEGDASGLRRRATAEALVYVDDSATARAVFRRSMAMAQVAIEVFASVAALHSFLQGGGSVRAALLDVDLGEHEGARVSGLDVAHMLRALAPAVPIAFYTSEPGALRDPLLTALGPVFTKEQGSRAAMAWLASHAQR